jgi:hypothetical protein
MENNKLNYKDFYKFLFLFDTVKILIEAEDKTKAIEKLKEEFPKLFNKDFNIIRIDRELTIDNQENLYL